MTKRQSQLRVLSRVWDREGFDWLVAAIERATGLSIDVKETRRSSSATVTSGRATLRLELDVESGITLHTEDARGQAWARYLIEQIMVMAERDRIVGP